MPDLSKDKKRLGDNWDLDLGWLLLWVVVLFALVAIIGFMCYTSVKNNKSNIERDKYYAEHCKIVFESQNSGRAYECQNR